MRKADGFQIIDYIRSSIEIIMNLKVEDLERETKTRNNAHSSLEVDSLNNSSASINP